MSLRRGRARAELNAEINVVSLIDVMMLLLVIFMITAPIMHGGIDITLPEADAPQVDPNKSGITLSITPTKIYIDETAYTPREFRAAFKAVAGARAKLGVNIASQANVTMQQFMDVVSVLRDAGVTTYGLLAAPVEGSRR
jgi:biopolymer transport protein ExbD/biopolymer transport protein TolR